MTDPAIRYLRHVLEAKNWTAADLSKRAGVAHSTINRPLTVEGYAGGISRQTLAKVFNASGIDPAPFLAAAGEPTVAMPSRVENHEPAPPAARLVRAYDVRASAGHGALVGYDEVDYTLAFPPDYMRRLTSTGPENLAIIGVVGDSMLPTIKEDDIVMVDLTKRDIDYDGMFVVRIGEVLKVKRLRWGPSRKKMIVLSDNRDMYPPEEYDANDDVEVIGRVIWTGGKV